MTTRKKRTKEDMGHVYFIRKGNESIFKIGVTRNDPDIRLSELQVGTSDKLTLYGYIHTQYPYELEYKLHKKFGQYRLSGEWFNISEIDINIILQKPEAILDWALGQRILGCLADGSSTMTQH